METSINPAKTALVVIDLQKGITAMDVAPHSAQDVIGRTAKLAAAFRKAGSPVFLVRVTPSADGKDALTPKTDAAPRGGDRPEGWADIVPELNQQPSDFVITKRQWGAFTGTELDLQMRRRGIDTIVLCGIATDIGCESTARFALELGYNQIFVEDAMATMNPEAHTHTMQVIYPRMGIVRSTDDVLQALGA